MHTKFFSRIIVIYNWSFDAGDRNMRNLDIVIQEMIDNDLLTVRHEEGGIIFYNYLSPVMPPTGLTQVFIFDNQGNASRFASGM